MDTAQQFERSLGRRIDNQLLKDGTAVSRESNLMNADQIRTLPRDDALLIFSNKLPIRLRTTPYFRTRKWRLRNANE